MAELTTSERAPGTAVMGKWLNWVTPPPRVPQPRGCLCVHCLGQGPLLGRGWGVLSSPKDITVHGGCGYKGFY